MANHKSSEKRARQSAKRNIRNRSYISRVRTAVKGFRSGVESLKAGKIQSADLAKMFSSVQGLLHSAVSKGVLHKNNASRRIKRLAQHLVA
ncbi:MAG: 30S ribosomal protein S20 [Oligoflexales bacterium]|nr:30S ribosomal protein S20 [Oligoflexales bacterium]